MSKQFDYIVAPGIYGSGEDHWQTIWEAQDGAMRRFAPSSWDLPDLEDWKIALSAAVEQAEKPVVLVVHSLANVLVGHWALESPHAEAVAGAFLVSVPDPSGPNYPTDAPSFTPPPRRRLPFPSLVVASDDDPFGNLAHTEELAAAWGSSVVTLRGLGHINAASDLGEWKTGRDLLTAFVAGL